MFSMSLFQATSLSGGLLPQLHLGGSDHPSARFFVIDAAGDGWFAAGCRHDGTIAAGADVFFVNGVPLIDISNPATPHHGSFSTSAATVTTTEPALAWIRAMCIDYRQIAALYRQYNLIQDTLGIRHPCRSPPPRPELPSFKAVP